MCAILLALALSAHRDSEKNEKQNITRLRSISHYLWMNEKCWCLYPLVLLRRRRSVTSPVHDVRLLFAVLHGGQMSIRPHHFSFFFSLVHALFDRSILDRPLSSTQSIRRGNTHKSSLVSHRNGVVLYNIIDRHK